MVRHFDAIYSQGAFRLLEPLVMLEGTRVHLSVEEDVAPNPLQQLAKISTPQLAHSKDAADFTMEVRETGNASL